MRSDYLKQALRFCCTVGEKNSALPLLEQGELAIRSGAVMIRYSGEAFSSGIWRELRDLCRLCKCNRIPFIVRDHLLLAKAIEADGLHLDQATESPEACRIVLGPEAIIGKTVRAGEEKTLPLSQVDYVEYASGMEFTGEDAGGLLTTISGITDATAVKRLFSPGVAGLTATGLFSEPKEAEKTLREMASACGCLPPSEVLHPWADEFQLISKLLQTAAQTKNDPAFLVVPPGDDAALLMPLSRPVVTTDTQREGVHFRLDWQSPEEIGRKAVTVTLSDLAASFARPVSLFVNLSLPPHLSEDFLARMYRGIGSALKDYACSLGGGNISGGREFSIDLMAIGQGREDLFPKRSEAKPGFGLYATGPLGLARAGLEALMRNDPDFPEFVKHFKAPRARFDAAGILAANRVACVMDISDGLSGDALHIAEASGITVELFTDALLGDDRMKFFCRKHALRLETLALSGGEDYELLFACPQETFLKVQNALPEAIQVGRCLTLQDCHLISPSPGISSYRHGR